MLTIVEVELEDAEAVLDYRNAVGKESDNLTYGKEGIVRTVEEERKYLVAEKSLDNTATYLVKIDGKIAAMGSLKGFEKTRIRHRAELALTVRRAFWNRGIATQMMETLIDYARQKTSIEVLELIVRSDNESAIHLYKKFGFKTIGSYDCFFKVGINYYAADWMVCGNFRNKANN